MLPSQEFIFDLVQNFGATATSTGSYIEIYIASPYVEINPSFNANLDCRVNINVILGWAYGWTTVTYVKASTYVKITIKGNANFLSTYGNLFPSGNTTSFRIKNLFYFPLASTNKIVYPIYWAMYKADVPNTPVYYMATLVSATLVSSLAGTNFYYVNNYYSTTNFMTYTGALRF